METQTQIDAAGCSPAEIPSIRVLGTRVHMIEIPAVIELMDRWIEKEHNQCHHIVNSGMHGLMEAHKDPELKSVFNSVELFAPDGILMILMARLGGFRIKKSLTGPQLMWQFGHIAEKKRYKYYFYGDEESTLQLLTERFRAAFPNLEIVGYHAPPFRALTSEEDEAIVATINKARPDVLWVGLGMPKQEQWIAEHRDKLEVPVVVGAGAALKLMSGSVKRAPPWLSDHGFEWFWRLIQEPKRMWRRVVIDVPWFIGLVALERSGLKKFD